MPISSPTSQSRGACGLTVVTGQDPNSEDTSVRAARARGTASNIPQTLSLSTYVHCFGLLNKTPAFQTTVNRLSETAK